MKNINNDFGSYMLVGLTIGAAINNSNVEASIFFVGALLFSAIKTDESE